MKQSLWSVYLFVAVLLIAHSGNSQSTNPYHINSNASQENCNCYTLTPDQFNQSGSVWNIYKINLLQSFDFKFEVFLGCADAGGADGIVFVLQPVSTSIGSLGGGLGYQGISPSIGVVIDTWQNGINNDPSYDHIAIHRNGNIDHGSADNLAGPVHAIENVDNIEDCKWHNLRITWDAFTKKLNAQIDGVDRVSITSDLVPQVFGGNPEVFWGFTGSTGGSRNHQRFCTSLNPSFILPPDLSTCFPATIPFTDESRSFGTILKWYWDFGDGKKDSTPLPPPHFYEQPGIYKAKLKILGNNGCVSDPFEKEIVIGSEPIANFKELSSIYCAGDTIRLLDSSYVQFGTIDNWIWNVNGQSFIGRDPGIFMPTGVGYFPVQLTVKTIEGCENSSPIRNISLHPLPEISFQDISQACLNDFIFLNAINHTNAIGIEQWTWQMGNGTIKTGNDIQYKYAEKGDYQVQLTALASNGCNSLPVIKTIHIDGTKAFAGNDTVVAINQPLQLQATGGEIYHWSPAAGINDPFIASPIAVLQKDATYVLTAAAGMGCETTDTIRVKVYKGPDFYVPSAFAPDSPGRNSRFRAIAPGMRLELFHVYNRFGQLVFSGRAEEGWNGEWNGKKQPTGTYVWMIRGKDYLGKDHFKKGTVTLVR